MADYAPVPVVNTGSTERPISDAPSKPAAPAGIAGLPAKPVFGGGPTFGDNAFAIKNSGTTANGDSLAITTKKDDSPSSSAGGGGVLNGSGVITATDKKDDKDFAKPVTPVSEANGGHDAFNGGDSHDKPSTVATRVAAPLPLTEETPAEKPGPSEPTAASIPTATAPPVTLVTPTAPATNGSNAVPSLAASLPTKPAESAAPSAPSTIVGEKRKVDEADDKPPAAEAPEPAPAPLSSLFGGPTAASLPAKPPTPVAGSTEDGESAAKKLKTDADAEAAAAVDAAPKSTPAAPPVEVPAPSPVTVATPAADPIPAPVGAPAAVAPALEVNLGPAPSAEEIASTSGPGVKKSTSRAKREKKPLPTVGKTARKTRSQGPV